MSKNLISVEELLNAMKRTLSYYENEGRSNVQFTNSYGQVYSVLAHLWKELGYYPQSKEFDI